MPIIIQKILKWSEKYTKTDMTYVFKNMSFLGGGQLAAALVTLGFAIFIADALPKEEYGNYKYILSVVALVNSLAFTGLGPALVRAIAGGSDGNLKQFSKINFFWSLIPASILTIGSIYYYVNDNTLLSLGLLIGALTLPFIERADLYASVLNGKKLFKFLSLASFIRNAVPTLAVALTAFFTLSPLYMAIAFFISTSIILNIFYYVTVYKFIKNTKRDNMALNLAKHSSFINIFALVSDQIDNIIVFQFLGGAQLAIYNFAEAIPSVINGFVKQIYVIAVPKFVKQNIAKSQINKKIISGTFIIIVSTLFICIAYALVAPYIFQYLFPKYMESVFYSQLIVFGIAINSLIPYAYLDSQKAIKEKYILSLFSNIPKIPLMFFGVIWYGILGLILARFIAKFIGLFVSLYLSLRLRGDIIDAK